MNKYGIKDNGGPFDGRIISTVLIIYGTYSLQKEGVRHWIAEIG